MDENHSRRTVLFISIFAVLALVIIFTTVYAVNSSKKKHGPKEKSATTETPLDDSEYTFKSGSTSARVLIEGLNFDLQELSLLDLDSGESLTLTYNGASDIRNRHDKLISATQLRLGYFADITYDGEKGYLASLHGCSDTFEYKGIMNLSIDDSLKKLTVSDTIYRYDDRLRILSGDHFITLADLDKTDIFTLSGIDDYGILLTVEKGHGYLELAGAYDFLGGVLSIGRTRQELITDPFRLTLSEGTYIVKAENEDYFAEAEIKISRDCISTFDLGPYGFDSLERGFVSFAIEPFGTELFIDGVKTAYDDPVALAFGYHDIEATLGGYNSYLGQINVGGNRQTCNISLSVAPVSENDPDEEASDSPASTEDLSSDGIFDSTSDTDPAGSSSDANETDDNTFAGENETEAEVTSTPEPTKEIAHDSDYHLIIECTEGTSVYIDGEFKGIIASGRLVLPKQLGTLAIRLQLDGYVTRNYTVEIESGNEDAEFSFPDMVKEN